MKTRALRVWIIVALTLVSGGAAVRMGWGLAKADHGGTVAILILLMVALGVTYALSLYLLIKPSLRKLKRRMVAILATIIAGGGIVGCVIHFVRFVPSPKASSPLSVVIASLLLASGVVVCGLILWVFWRLLRRRGD